MKLRSTSRSQQLLFLATCGLSIFAHDAFAQAQSAAIKMKTGAVQQGVITGVTASGVGIQLAAGGSISIPLAQIDSVSMAPPPEYNLALQAVALKDIPKASGIIRGLLAKYRGLPADWAQQAAALEAQTGVSRADLQLAQNELDRALQLVSRGFISKADVDR